MAILWHIQLQVFFLWHVISLSDEIWGLAMNLHLATVSFGRNLPCYTNPHWEENNTRCILHGRWFFPFLPVPYWDTWNCSGDHNLNFMTIRFWQRQCPLPAWRIDAEDNFPSIPLGTGSVWTVVLIEAEEVREGVGRFCRRGCDSHYGQAPAPQPPCSTEASTGREEIQISILHSESNSHFMIFKHIFVNKNIKASRIYFWGPWEQKCIWLEPL